MWLLTSLQLVVSAYVGILRVVGMRRDTHRPFRPMLDHNRVYLTYTTQHTKPLCVNYIMQEAGSGEKTADRQCWECFKRRLVCDRTLPLCKKCPKAGKECSGYNEQKPLQWVEPGKVSLRPRKRDSPQKKFTIRPRNSETSAAIIASVPVTAHLEPSEPGPPEPIPQEQCLTLAYPLVEGPQVTPEAIELYESHLASLLVQEDKAAWWHNLEAEKQMKHIKLMATEAAAASGVGERIMRIGNQDQIKEVVERGQHWEAAVLLQSNQNPLAKIQRLLQVMQMNKLPSYDFLSDEICEVVHAVSYCRYALPDNVSILSS